MYDFNLPHEFKAGHIAIEEISKLGWKAWPTQFRCNGYLFCLTMREDTDDGELQSVHYNEYLGDRKVMIIND